MSELVDGGTLRDWAKASPRSWQEVVELVIGLADGLATAHEAGILHRDVKPENILITRSDYAKLADFGLAKLRESPSLVAEAPTETRTRPGAVVGTVAYMSPDPEMTGLGGQMSIVSATERRTAPQNVYVPPGPWGIAHRSYRSPDGQWALVVEMDIKSWLPCRLVPFAGGAEGRPVGPQPAQCTDAAWSPDGRWMYFTAMTANGVHVWRQGFPNGIPEQVTFGASSEEGIHLAPDGRSFVTSVGTSQSTLWVHDARGDRQITSEGHVFMPALWAVRQEALLPDPLIRPELGQHPTTRLSWSWG